MSVSDGELLPGGQWESPGMYLHDGRLSGEHSLVTDRLIVSAGSHLDSKCKSRSLIDQLIEKAES